MILLIIDETILTEIRLKKFFLLSYRSPSHTSVREIINYCKQLHEIVDKIHQEYSSFVILSGDFNVRLPLFGTANVTNQWLEKIK